MNKICTTLEQSQKLIKLGIDVDTADIWWVERYKRHATMDYKYIVEDEPYYYLSLTKPSNDNYSQDIVKGIPAWSLSALMDLLPKGEDTVIDLCFGGYKGEEYIDEWFCSFENNKEPFEFHSYSNKDKLDVIFEMIVWLKENNKL